MRFDVVGLNVEVTDAIREYAETKSSKLTKFFDGIQQIVFRLSNEDHQQHSTFNVEVTTSVVKHDDFVANASGDDLYTAIDTAVHKSTRQIKDYKEKLRQAQRGE